MPGYTLNPFNNDAFSMAMLTESMLRLPYNMYTRVSDLGIFTDQGVATTSVLVEEMGGSLTLIPTTPRGAPAIVNNIGKRKVRSFAVPHVALDDVILPGEVQGVREFGTTNELRTLATLMNQKLQTMKNKFDQTLEWMRVGALKGVLYDADGSTVIYNFFNEFNITPFVVNFQFTNVNLDVVGTINNIKRHMEDFLHGESMTGVRALVSPTFFDALVSHPNVKQAFQYFMTTQPLGYDYRTGFVFSGVTFEEYRGVASDLTGTAHKFIPDGTAQFFPMGTNSTFRTYFAPADFNETVNTLGLKYYAKQKPRDFERGTDVHTQMNPLPICLRPELLVQGTMS